MQTSFVLLVIHYFSEADDQTLLFLRWCGGDLSGNARGPWLQLRKILCNFNVEVILKAYR